MDDDREAANLVLCLASEMSLLRHAAAPQAAGSLHDGESVGATSPRPLDDISDGIPPSRKRRRSGPTSKELGSPDAARPSMRLTTGTAYPQVLASPRPVHKCRVSGAVEEGCAPCLAFEPRLQFCPKEYARSDKLLLHVGKAHGGGDGGSEVEVLSRVAVPSFACQECGAVLSRREYLERHMREQHDRVRPFHCDACGQAFARKGDLEKHWRSRKARDMGCGEAAASELPPPSARAAHAPRPWRGLLTQSADALLTSGGGGRLRARGAAEPDKTASTAKPASSSRGRPLHHRGGYDEDGGAPAMLVTPPKLLASSDTSFPRRPQRPSLSQAVTRAARRAPHCGLARGAEVAAAIEAAATVPPPVAAVPPATPPVSTAVMAVVPTWPSPGLQQQGLQQQQQQQQQQERVSPA